MTQEEELEQYFETLLSQFYRAQDHLTIFKALNLVQNSTDKDFMIMNNFPGFWTYTFSAHLDMVLYYVCKCWLPVSSSHKETTINLHTFLTLVKSNLSLFNYEHFKKRCNYPHLFEELDRNVLNNDINNVLMSRCNKEKQTLLANLQTYRNEYLCHLDKCFHKNNNFEILISDLGILIKEGLEILNFYKCKFDGSESSNSIVKSNLIIEVANMLKDLEEHYLLKNY